MADITSQPTKLDVGFEGFKPASPPMDQPRSPPADEKFADPFGVSPQAFPPNSRRLLKCEGALC